MAFTGSHEYLGHTPGHAGGTAFRKSQVGKAFYDFYGESLFRTDLSVSVAELGSLSTTPDRSAKRSPMRPGSSVPTRRTSFSTVPRLPIRSWLTRQLLPVSRPSDRNCHKSINYALAVTDAIPVYLMPERNGYGIIVPIPIVAVGSERRREGGGSEPLGWS